MSKRLLRNDNEFKRAIEKMVEFDRIIRDPLKSEEVKKESTWRLNATAELVQVYSRGKEVQENPSRAAYYDQMGWSYQDFTTPAETVQTAPKTNTPTETKQAPEQPIEPPKTASKVSSWLDD